MLRKLLFVCSLSVFLAGPLAALESSRYPQCSAKVKVPSAEQRRESCRPLTDIISVYPKNPGGEHNVRPCERKSRWQPDQKTFERILSSHLLWLEDPTTGERANLCGADLTKIKLPRGQPLNLSYAILSSTDISGLDLSDAIMHNTNLCSARLHGTRLDRIQANYAMFWHVHASESRFVNASLCSAGFPGADLNQANFWDANLSGARLTSVEVNGTRLAHANLRNVQYEPLKGSPEVYLGTAKGLGELHVKSYPRGLTQLRNIAMASGNPEQVREISASMARIKSQQQLHLTHPTDIFRAVASALFIAFVGAPTNWGLSMWIPFTVLGFLFMGFSAVYYREIRKGGGRIVVIQPADRIILEQGQPTQASASNIQPADGSSRGSSMKYALLYSLQTTFFFVADSFKVSNWVNRLNPDEERVAGIARMRTLGGVQSILSLYLVALWLAVSFGDLFS